jgi:hypothetical protein
MPDPSERKHRKKALERAKKKYIECPDEQNPYHVYSPIKEATEILRSVMNTRNYVRIMTQIDLNKFLVMQYYVYCDNDIWACGDSFVFNCNSDKKILVQPICSRAKKECICHHESSNQFISICPGCKEARVMVLGTPYTCEKCGFTIDYKKVNDMPFAKIPCEWCPKEIGWDKTQKLKSMIMKRLIPRSHMVAQSIEQDMAKFEKDLK